ncbi:FK506-binding protein 5 [Parasteatoda tepidariorum]|uniref:FK506-binding protein 5 n=1 Tax=Parasteatoda tepidariorum TaxID=114398 RepID=UPI001C7234AF|nr:triadin [Parasteatoda tepidariorum]
MTEQLNGHYTQINEENRSSQEVISTAESSVIHNKTKEISTVAKTQRKKVSFHENVTDIDDENESSAFENGDNLEDIEVEETNLEEILNVSEKINFFKTAFANGSQTKDDNGIKSLGHQSSIPEARLAFVTGMVDSSSTGNNSRVNNCGGIRVESNVTIDSENVAQKDEGDIELKTETSETNFVQVPTSPEDVSESATESNMAATQVTFMKIFATPKSRHNMIEAVVDTTSILEHREELRELWEKRMMADDNQSSPSSTVEEKSKISVEEVKEDGIIKPSQDNETTKLQSEKIANGHAKTLPESVIHMNDTNANHIHEEHHEGSEVQASKTIAPDEEDQENNNSADSLEIDNNNEIYVEEKTYTSELETSLVVKQVTEVTAIPAEDHKETIHNETVSDGTVTTTTQGDGQTVINASPEKESNSIVDTREEEPSTATLVDTEVVGQAPEKLEESVQETVSTTKEAHNELVDTSVECDSVAVAPMKGIDIPTNDDEEGDGFVPLAECLPQEEGFEDTQSIPSEVAEKDVHIEEHKAACVNSISEASESTPSTSTPEPSVDDKQDHPEIEQFVKSGGLKRILPGVQKTEQPYSSCTTETKIAMEIREMREREEELRVMREQALLSPVISPVPPKSPGGRSPSPSVKDSASPSPTPSGTGYRVSSVFGHKGTISPSPPIIEEEKKVFKMAAKETAVEKEIRLAREREEELRNQKGLPPREDDSYVKPSQVKSSQVRIFGKAGTNSASIKQAATAKIQLEIEEQTQREMALREAGSIQTISHERTDAKVAKLKTPECTTPPLTNGNSQSFTNGNHTNGRHSPDVAPYKRSSPSPTGIAGRPASIFSQTNGSKNISMQKFIASKGKETTFTNSRNGGPFILPKEEKPAAVPPTMVKLKRNVSVESKIQQEIMEMKQREEELKKLHMKNDENSNGIENGKDHEMNQKNNLEYENGNGINEEDISPRHNKLIAQWEQRIQKAES